MRNFLIFFAIAIVLTKCKSAETNLTLSQFGSASSVETDGTQIHKAFDGNMETRWGSAENSDKEWIFVDLESSKTISKVVLKWEFSYAKSYSIDVSDDALSWTSIFETTTNDGDVDSIDAHAVKARYVRMNAKERATIFGYSLHEFEVLDELSKNIALNKPVQASSVETDGTQVFKAFDGKLETRWGSAENSDLEWIAIDLGKQQKISKIVLNWELAFAISYELQISNDAKTWKTIYATTDGNGETDLIEGLSEKGRYVKMKASKRGSEFGYSLLEFEVY